MIDPKTVQAGERGLIRIYAIDLPDDRLPAFTQPQFNGDAAPTWAFQNTLGAAHLEEEFVKIFPMEDLEGLGMAGYLIEGNGVAEADVAPYRELLDGLEGTVAVVFSAAFGGTAQVLSPAHPLRYIAAFSEEAPDIRFKTLPNPDPERAPQDTAHKKRPSDAAMSGRIATFALLLMGLLVWLMIRIAG